MLNNFSAVVVISNNGVLPKTIFDVDGTWLDSHVACGCLMQAILAMI